MRQAKVRSPSATRQRGGAALLLVVFVSIAVGGLSVSLAIESRGANTDVGRSDGQVRALELAEIGLARAHTEIAALVDHDDDGVGNAHGAFAGGSYSVTATNDGSDDWTLRSTGRCSGGQRVIEQGVRRTRSTASSYAILAKGNITVSGGVTSTDAYDSRLGSYASQATNVDATGHYGLGRGGVGANGNITVSAGRIRGDAIPGTAGTTSISGGGVVTGTTARRTEPLDLPDPPYADFLAASATNSNGNWTTSGGSVSYDRVQKTFSASGTVHVTMPGGTYFFTKFSVSGGSTVEFTGPAKIYVVGAFSTSGGSITNMTGFAKNVSVIAHPYAIPGLPSTKSISSSVSGGTGTILTYYGPSTKLTISGGSDIFGAFVGQTVAMTGGTGVHYDVALTAFDADRWRVAQLYWNEPKPPLY